MTKFTNKATGVTVDVENESDLPGIVSDWDSGGPRKSRRRADTGAVPVQNNNQ